MVESYVLAGELARDPQNHQEAFRRYEERLRPLVETKQKSARDFAASFAPRTAWGIWLRNQVTKAMAVPGVARLVIGASLKDNIELPDYRVAQFRAGASAEAL
jgi:2-polyprenyl-6-methoxyphenol hydroxylase-like FAD-dependent oxidoreductase